MTVINGPLGELVTVGTEPVACWAATLKGAGTLSISANTQSRSSKKKVDFRKERIFTTGLLAIYTKVIIIETMQQRIFHGNLTPTDMAGALLAHFNRGNLRTQLVGESDSMRVQIATRPGATSGGQTALTVQIQQVEDGVMVSVGDQAWLGMAADMGETVIATLMNPINLLGRLDDIAQDIESLQIVETVWQVIGKAAQAAGASTQLSERLQRLMCEFCNTANPVGQRSCIACGAPLGNLQPRTCPTCGFVVLRGEQVCPSCDRPM